MGKRCGFCKSDTGDDRAFEVCDRCGKGIWGEKMFNTIRSNMEGAKESGNLFQGSVSGQ